MSWNGVRRSLWNREFDKRRTMSFEFWVAVSKARRLIAVHSLRHHWPWNIELTYHFTRELSTHFRHHTHSFPSIRSSSFSASISASLVLPWIDLLCSFHLCNMAAGAGHFLIWYVYDVSTNHVVEGILEHIGWGRGLRLVLWTFVSWSRMIWAECVRFVVDEYYKSNWSLLCS